MYIFVKQNVIYVTLWILEEWSSVQRASIDSLSCHNEQLYNEYKLCDILLKVVSLLKHKQIHISNYCLICLR